MADTVKKSRIVSETDEDNDKNLEETLLEEFNMRLKNCMSKDDLKQSEEEQSEPQHPTNIYESINQNHQNTKIIPHNGILASQDLINSESSENYYEEPNIFTKNGTHNGHDHLESEEEENIYENIPEKTELTDQLKDLNLDVSPSKDKQFVDEDVSYEVVMTAENKSYDDVPSSMEEIKSKPTFALPTTCFTDFSELTSPESDMKSVKDRMFLCSDDTSTLLFTQTVTSPMLTPSEENIDFLKGFQRENTNSESTTTSSPPKEEPKNSNDVEEKQDSSGDISISENMEEEKVLENGHDSKNLYQNIEFLKNNVGDLAEPVEENIYENIDEIRKIEPEPVYQNVPNSIVTEGEKAASEERSIDNELDEKESIEEFLRNEKMVTEALEEEIIIESNEKEPDDTKIESEPEESLIEELETDQIEESRVVDTNEEYQFSIEEEDKKESIKSEYTEQSIESYKEFVYHSKSETHSNYYEKYTEVLTKNKKNEISNREKDTESVPAEIVKNLKSQFLNKTENKSEPIGITKRENRTELKLIDVTKTINKFEHKDIGDGDNVNDSNTEYSETIVETNAPGEKMIKKKKTKKTRTSEKENISVKSSFSKFDALQKKNVLHVRSSDSSKAQEKFNGAQIDPNNCKKCGKQVFQMEQIKAERAVWHKNCFRCTECSKQLAVDGYESNEGSLYCKPHFKALFAPKAVEEEAPPSDKPDLGLEELQSLNVKERFQVFEHHQTETSETERGHGTVNVKKSPSILSKLARFQKHGMDVGVSNEALDGIPVEESSTEEEEEEEVIEGDDAELVRAKKVQKEKPFHFTGMSDVKKRWEMGDQSKDERREETKQEIQSIRNRLFMGKQEKMKEAYQQAIMESESSTNVRKNLNEKIEVCDTKSIKERFEKGEVSNEKHDKDKNEEEEVYESEISKKSRSLFLELDAGASKPPQVAPVTPPKLEVKKAREAYLNKTASEDTIKSTESVEDVEVKTADIQQRFKFFETYKEPEKERKQFRITPPRDPSQVKTETPEREIYRDPNVVRSEEYVEDSTVAKETHTATKMLNKFRQMEENQYKEQEIVGLKPLKRFTPPLEPARTESNSEGEESSEYEEEEEQEEEEEEVDHSRLPEDLVEAQKAARAKQLRAKFERWEQNEIKREQQNAVNISEEFGEEQSQIESTRVLRARFESMKETSSETSRTPRVKVNRFV